MKVASVTAEHGLTTEDRPTPVPGRGEVLVQVLSAGICGSDLHMLPLVRQGTVLGHEIAGTVAAVGEGVANLEVGDIVCSMPAVGCGACVHCLLGDPVHCPEVRLVGAGRTEGSFAEYVIVGERESVVLPPSIDPVLGSLVEPLAVGLAIFERSRLGIGDRLVILGAGPVGLAVALWARTMGVADIVVSDPVASRRALAEQVGATATVDPLAVPLADFCADTLGGPPEVVIECAGRPGTLDEAAAVVAHEGRIVIAGMHLEPSEQFDRKKLYLKSAAVQFSSWYTLKHFRHTVRMWDSGRLDPSPLVTHRVDLDGLADVVEELQRPNELGKVIITPSQAPA
jgi:threonine dehydrogenase-like Zn-dependent dehydrogenase